jgi:phospholipase A1
MFIMKIRTLALLAGTALVAPGLALAADSAGLKAELLACGQKDGRDLEECIRGLARKLDTVAPAKAASVAAGADVPAPLPRAPLPPSANTLAQQFSEQWALAEESEPSCLRYLCSYRPSYIIARNSSSPNAWPSSPAPGHTVTSPVADLANEMKFQISFKSLVAQPDAANRWQVWAAYTQQSHWQLFNASVSRPFRESNYEPEIYINRRWEEGMPGYDWHLRMLGVGFVHQSNGQSNPLSRSWNRTYLQGGFVWDDWILLAKAWKRWHEASGDDDNPGIENYIGRAEATLTWAPDDRKLAGKLVSLRFRHSLNPAASHGSAQLELSGPLRRKGDFRWFLQGFRGYGETMLDYNHLQNSFGVGVGILDW